MPHEAAPATKAKSIPAKCPIPCQSPRAAAAPKYVVTPVKCVTASCVNPSTPVTFTIPAKNAINPAAGQTHRGNAVIIPHKTRHSTT